MMLLPLLVGAGITCVFPDLSSWLHEPQCLEVQWAVCCLHHWPAEVLCLAPPRPLTLFHFI